MHCSHRSSPSESTCSMTMTMRQIVINGICFYSHISPHRPSGHSWRQIGNSLLPNLLSHSIHLYVPKPICGLMIETHTEMIHVCLCTASIPRHDKFLMNSMCTGRTETCTAINIYQPWKYQQQHERAAVAGLNEMSGKRLISSISIWCR